MAVDSTNYYGAGVGMPSAATMGGFSTLGAGGSSSPTPTGMGGMATIFWALVFLGGALILLHLE